MPLLIFFTVTIQSVLDVKDDNPPPKGMQAVFNRSILILTPQRALKFTAVNADRHYLWLTALSFLAHSQQDVPEMPIPTPVPTQRAPDLEIPAVPPSKFSRNRKPRIRDSIRLAKSQNPVLNHPPVQRPLGGLANTMSSQSVLGQGASERTMSPVQSIPDVPMSIASGYQRSVSAAAASDNAGSSYSRGSNGNANHNGNNATHLRDESIDAAEPPTVPRFGRDPAPPVPAPSQGFHGRKRSNTGGGRIPPPLSFRGFAGAGPGSMYDGSHHAPTNSTSTNTGSSDLYFGHGNSVPRSSIEPSNSGAWPSGRTSEASSEFNRGSVRGGNLFEAIGTMRMEAFISPLAYSRYESDGQLNYPDPLEDQGRARARKRNKDARRRKSRSRSRSRTRESFTKGGVAAWREEYFGGGYANERGHGHGHGHGRGRADGYRTAGEEEWTGGRRDPFEGF